MFTQVDSVHSCCVYAVCMRVHLRSLQLRYAELQVNVEMNLTFLVHPPLSISLLCGTQCLHPRGCSLRSLLVKCAESKPLSRSICADLVDNVYHVCWFGERWGVGG